MKINGTKLKFIPVCIILLLGVSNCFLPVFDKDVGCTAMYTIQFINKSNDTLGVRLINFHSQNDDKKITIFKDTCLIMPQSSNTDSIKYSWTGKNDCVFVGSSAYNIFADVYLISMPYNASRRQLCPWDTTKSLGPSFCGDCTHTYTDTLYLP